MQLRSTAILISFISALFISSHAHAIVYGELDNMNHPNVGALVSPTQYSDGTWLYCSGTLISPTVFLTAAHCDTGVSRVKVTFDTQYEANDKTYAGTMTAHPQFRQNQSDPYDIAVVVLDEPITEIAPARLPTANSLSKLSTTKQFVSVGFGAYEVTSGPGGHQMLYNDTRNFASGTLNSTNPAWLRISQNPSRANGGTCYGDSGGPNFLGTTNIIAGLTITGDAICRSRNVIYRLDTPAARDFLRPFVTLP